MPATDLGVWHRAGRPLTSLLLLLGTGIPVAAQQPPITVPGGLLRVGIEGRFDDWDRRYLDGRRVEEAAALGRTPFDATALAALADAERRVRTLTGRTDLSLILGGTRAANLVNLGTTGISAAYGITSRLTIFGSVPIVRVRTRPTLTFDSAGATAAFNPDDPLFGNASGAGNDLFFAELDGALATLQSRLAAGDYDADPARRALAESVLLSGTGLRGGLFSLLRDPGGAAQFLPLAGSVGGQAITDTVNTLRTALAGPLGVGGFTASPVLPIQRMTPAEFLAYLGHPGGPVGSFAGEPLVVNAVGDVEVGTALLWLATERIRSVAQVLVRLPTGRPDNPDELFDAATGDRQTDVEAALVTDLHLGRVGTRLTAGYTLQRPGPRERRIAAAGEPLPSRGRLARLEWDPGEVVFGAVEPFARIAPSLAVVGGAHYWRKGADQYRYAEGQAPVDGLDANLLAEGTRSDATSVSLGLSYVSAGGGTGVSRFPLDATLRWQKVVRSGRGSVPAVETLRLQLRLSWRPF